MFSTGSGALPGLPRPAALLFVVACVLAAALPTRTWADTRESRDEGVLAEVASLAGAGRYAAAESLLRTLPAPPADSAARLDQAEADRERVWLRVRGFAPGACDTTWTWRPARAIAALERLDEPPALLAETWADRSRVEYRLGLWPAAAASARSALALLDAQRVRDPLPRYRAQLALAEVLSTHDAARARTALRAADSLARARGAVAMRDRPRHLRIAGMTALLDGDIPGAIAKLSASVAAADSLSPTDDAEAGLALVFQGYAESFADAARGDAHRSSARERMEAAIGLGDERTLQVIARSTPSRRDPAQLPRIAALFDRTQDYLREHGLSEIAGAWETDYYQSRVKIALVRYDESLELLRHAIAVSRRWHGPDNLREMTATLDMGIVYWLKRDTTAALPYFRRALEIGARFPVSLVNDPNLPRNYLAAAYAAKGRLAEAREEYRAQWEYYRSRYGAGFKLASAPAARAARCSRGLGDTAQAETWYQRALLPFASGESGTLEEVTEVRASYALFLYWRGDYARAFELLRDATRLRRRVVEETVPWLPEADAVRFANQRRQEQQTLMSLALWTPGAPPEVRAGAWSEMALGRGLLLEALLRRVHRPADSSASGDGTGDLRRRLATEVLASLKAPDSRAMRRHLDSLRAEIVRRELGESGPGERAGPGGDLRAGDVTARLAGGTLVSYLRTELFEKSGALGDAVWWPKAHYMAFVLAAGDSAPRVLLLGAADSIDAAVGAWRAAALAKPPARDAWERGVRLRGLVWDPVAPLVPASGQVWVVPDGELQKVNLYALPAGPVLRTGTPGRYLVDEPLVLHRLSSERDLLSPPGEAAAAQGMLVFGSVDYEHARPAPGAGSSATPSSAPPACRAFLDERFAPLPATGGEAAAIMALGRSLLAAFGPATGTPLVRTGLAADEASFKRLAPGRRIIHLATHSFFLGAECATGPNAASVLEQNPLVFSGIALAGANRWQEARERKLGEDGLLTAEELAGLDLRGTEWLVLSGCESGLGQVQSWEGVFGLPRAGRRAGVRTLVMSVAPVDDEAGSMWMRALYEARFTNGEETSLAVRTASRRVLDWLRAKGREPEPRLWGAFVALGE